MEEYRVIPKIYRVLDLETHEIDERFIQLLQVKHKFLGIIPYWKTIDKETVPSGIWLASFTLGGDLSGWKSKFADIPNVKFIKKRKSG